MSLRLRIVLPFVTLFTLAYAATVLAAVSIMRGAAEERLVDRARNLDELIRRVPGAVNFPQYATFLDPVYQARVAYFQDGAPTAFRSVSPDEAEALQREKFWPPPDTFTPWRGYLAVRHGGALLLYPGNRLDEERRAVVRPLVGIAAAGLLVVVALGWLLGQSIARPLERLAAKARAVGGGGLAYEGGGPEMAQLVEALNRMAATLREAERLATMGRMSAGVAHEIKNPLAAMKMTVQMLREERAGGEREPLDLLLREIDRLDLVATELSASGRPLAKQPVELDRAVVDVLDLLAPQMKHLGVTVERRILPTGPVRVDPDRFKRAAMNLVLNGAQSMPSGGPLTVELATSGDRVRFSVRDAGPGIPPELRDRIFEPFVTTKTDGVGLGLALTRRIVEDHGGRIGFDASDRGSTFWIELPVG